MFCDISKTFDRVWHKGLIYKLKRLGITGNLLSWITDYLEDRKQKVVHEGFLSGWEEVDAGVPQWSVLGPLLFLLYINDITSELACNIKFFANDTSLFIIIDDSNYIEASEILSTDLSRIHTCNWSEIGLLNLILIKLSLFYLQEKIMLITIMYILEIQTT